MTVSTAAPKRVESGLAASFAAAGIPLSKEAQAKARNAERAAKLAADLRAEAQHAANEGVEDYKRRAATFYIEQAEANLKGTGPASREAFPESPPNLALLAAQSEAARQVANMAQRDFDRFQDPEEVFKLIEERWETVVEWRRSADPKSLTLAEAERLEADAEKAREALLNLSTALARFDADNEQERKNHRRLQRSEGRPVSLAALRKAQERAAKVSR